MQSIRGAKCYDCPLRSQDNVVDPPRLGKSKIAIIGEAPGYDEEREGKFFVGASGRVLDAALRTRGKVQAQVRITNALLCRPQKELSPEEWHTALDCCKPRLLKDIKNCTHILTLGKRAWHALSPYKNALMPWIGSPLIQDGRTIIPSLHPAFCLRGKRQFIPIVHTFIHRIFDLQEGKEDVFRWKDLSYYGGGPSAISVLEHLSRTTRMVGIDIETGGIDPLTSPITAIGLATTSCGVSVLWPSTRHTSDRAKAKRIRELIQAVLRNKAEKICHNGAHDITGLRKAGFSVNNYTLDTLLMHHVAGNLLPHNLGFVSQVEFPVDPWKIIFKVTGDAKGLARFLTARKEELTLYNAKDTQILPYLVPRLFQRIHDVHNGHELYEGYFKRAEIAARMRVRGVKIDHDAVWRHKDRLTPKIKRCSNTLRKVATKIKPYWGKKKDRAFNIASRDDLCSLFFVHLRQQPLSYTTKTKKPKLDAKVLQSLAASTHPLVRSIARQVLLYRQHTKLYASFVKPVSTIDDKVHPEAKVWGTKTGRWSYVNPPIQTIPPEMRDVFVSSDGMYIVQADYSQLELRVVAFLANDEEMLHWYATGVDVHTQNALLLFGDKEKDPEKRKKLRELAKRFVYGANYGGDENTIWASLVPKHPELTLSDVIKAKNRWHAGRKAITKWQTGLLKKANFADYVEAPLSGRREYFHRQPERTKILNFPIQTTGADIIDGAVKPLWHSLRQINSWILFQMHDAFIVETPYPREAAKRMTRWMSRPVVLDGRKCRFPIDFKVGKAWGGDETTTYDKWQGIPSELSTTRQ